MGTKLSLNCYENTKNENMTTFYHCACGGKLY